MNVDTDTLSTTTCERAARATCRNHIKPKELSHGGGNGLPPIDNDDDGWRWEPEPDPEENEDTEYSNPFLMLDVVCGSFCLVMVLVTLVRIFWLP